MKQQPTENSKKEKASEKRKTIDKRGRVPTRTRTDGKKNNAH